MRLILVYVLAWASGLAAYVACLYLLWGQTSSSGDMRAVMFWSAVASAVAVVLVYAPLLFALRRWLGERAGTVMYGATSVMLGVIPVLIIITVFGGNLRSLMTPEAFLFVCLFTVFGLVFGAGFSWAYGKRPGA